MDWPELRILLKALLLPPASPLCVAALGLMLSFVRPRAGRALVAIGLAAVWLTSTWWLADRMFAVLESGQRPLDAVTLRQALDGPDPPRAVVVVTTGGRRDGLYEPEGERLLTRSLERAVAAGRIAKQADLPVYVQGFTERNLHVSSATWIGRLLENDLGVRVRRVDDGAGTGHAEIGRRIAALLAEDGIRSVIVSTHAHNMPRLRPALEAAGVKVLPAPHTFRAAQTAGLRAWMPEGDAAEANGIAFYEWLGRLSYRLPGRELDPAAAPVGPAARP